MEKHKGNFTVSDLNKFENFSLKLKLKIKMKIKKVSKLNICPAWLIFPLYNRKHFVLL